MAVACPVCRADAAKPKLHKGPVEILECAACGLRFWLPESNFRASDIYDDDYFASSHEERGYDDYAALEATLRTNFARRIRRIPIPHAGARLLDVGAAYGFAADEAKRAGWLPVALEVSKAAAKRAARVAGDRTIVGDALHLPFQNRTFDALTMWDVLEHLPDPQLAMAESARVLRPGGSLVLTTGDVGSLAARLSGPRWHLYTIPEHLYFHTRRSVRVLLAAHGFEVVTLRAETSVYPLGYLVERLRKTLLKRTTPRALRWRGSRIPIPVNLYDVMIIRAVLSQPQIAAQHGTQAQAASDQRSVSASPASRVNFGS